MKKILLSMGSLLFAVAILAGGTGAFLSDSGTSTGNTFASGVIELKIDNESYATDNWGKLYFSTSTSWSLSSLAGKLFFNFTDVKPGDIGEDTISLHVNNNNAYACMNVKLTDTPENGQNAPESLVDNTSGIHDGELQNYQYFVFWADDGDNVYEKGEKVFKEGLVKDIFNGKNWTIADSQSNIWDGSGPIVGNTTKYIGKAWCLGNMTHTPVSQDGLGKTGGNGPLVRGTGFSCNGVDVGNIIQSDGIKVDVNFSVVQSRNNGAYQCSQDHDTPKGNAHFVARKIVCDKESDLPNWGADNGGNNISSTTAATWVATHASCHLVPGWKFQYTTGFADNPGDTLTGEAGAPWVTTPLTTVGGITSWDMAVTPTTDVVSVREVLQTGYIPFTHEASTTNSNDFSAEMYCTDDVVNYDNLEYIMSPVKDKTYYCVAWNARKVGTNKDRDE